MPRIPRATGKSKPETLFVNIRRSKVDRDVGGRGVVTAVLERRAYAIPTLTEGGIGQTDGMKCSSIVLIPNTSTSTSIMLASMP